jgi:hypothetical protein
VVAPPGVVDDPLDSAVRVVGAAGPQDRGVLLVAELAMEVNWANQASKLSGHSIFLAGPTLRGRACRNCGGAGKVYHIPGSVEDPCHRCLGAPFREWSWRQDALRILKQRKFDGRVFVPEYEDFASLEEYAEANDLEGKELKKTQPGWELERLNVASCIAFWIPRDLTWLPGFTTNVEFGFWVARRPERVICGWPSGAPKTSYLDKLIELMVAPHIRHRIGPYFRLEEVLHHAVMLANS